MALVNWTINRRNAVIIGAAAVTAVGVGVIYQQGADQDIPAFFVEQQDGTRLWQINGSGASAQSGAVRTENVLVSDLLTNCDTVDTTSTGQLICGSDAGGGLNQSLADDRYVNESGDTMTGSLTVKANMSGYTLHVSSAFSGAGLSSCNNGTNDKLLWNSTTEQFECGSDQDTGGGGGGTSVNTGALIGVFDNRYVETAGDTMTGSLTLSGTSLAASGTIMSETLLTGASVHASSLLTSSGTLTVEGSVFLASITSCDTIDTDGNGLLSCGTDDNTFFSGTGALKDFFDGTFVNKAGDTMTGTLTISGAQLRVSTGNNDQRLLVEETGAVSASGTIFTEGQLAASGTLSVDGDAFLQGNATVSTDLTVNGGNVNFGAATTIGDGGDAITIDSDGTLTINDGTIDLSNQTVNVTLNSAADSLNIDSDTLSIDASSNRIGILTSVPDVALDVIGTMSGIVLHAADLLTSSGGLAIEGSFTGSTALYGSGLSDCDAATSKLTWNVSTGLFGCGTDDDVPEAGDFGNATDFDSNGALNEDTVETTELDDAGNSPTSGDVVTVNTGGANFNYAGGSSGQLLISQGTSQPVFSSGALRGAIGFGGIGLNGAGVTTGTGGTTPVPSPFGFFIEDVELDINLSPGGQSLIVDVLNDGTSIFSTRPEIDAGSKQEDGNHVFTANGRNIDFLDRISFQIDQVGSSGNGTGMTILLRGYRYP